MTDTCLVLAGGEAVLPAEPLPQAVVIAADGGLALADHLGLAVDVLVGDLDSADPEAIGRARESGARIDRHPTDKDATDLELALDAASARGCRRVIIVGGTAPDRFDHLLANAGLLASPRYRTMALEWRIGATRVVPLHDTVALKGEPGDIVSIIPAGGTAIVTTSGLQWPLDGETVDPHSSRSISNRLVGRDAEISVSDGRALVVHTRGTP